MPQDATCPGCKHIFPVTEARQPFTVPCPKCETELTVEFKKPATTPEAGQPPFDLLVKPGSLPESATQIAPEKKRKDDYDDETKRKGGSAMIVFLSGGFGLLFVLGGLALTGWYLFTQIDYETTSTYYNRNNNNPWPNNPGPNPKGGNNPKGGGNPGGGNPGGGNPGPVIPKDVFDLKPVTGTVPQISAAPLSDELSTIELGTRVGQIAVGGGGRYLVMHFPDKGQLCLFDASTAKTSIVSADSGDVKLAAGLSRMVVWAPNGNMLRVYSLPNMAKVFEANSPFDNYKSLAMGSRTNGPVLGVGTFGDLVLLDISGNSLKEIEGARGKPGHHWNNLRASPDGTAFATFDGYGNNNRVKLLTESNRKWKVQDLPQVPFPGPDGNFYGNGTAASRTGQQLAIGGVGAGSGTWYIPAVSGTNSTFLKLSVSTTGTGVKAKRSLSVTIHTNRNADTPANGTTALIGLPEFDGLVDIRNNNTLSIPWDKNPDQHFFLIPEAKLLVTLSANREKLHLRKIDLR